MSDKPTIVDLPKGIRKVSKKPASPADIGKSIGVEIRTLRQASGMNIQALASLCGLSTAMLSRIERGNVSPSISSLAIIAQALHVPVGRLFANVENRSDVSVVKAGHGITVQRFGAKADQTYELLGNLLSGHLFVEPYLITIDAPIKEKSAFQHTGVEFIHVLEGSMSYRYGQMTQLLGPGDSMLFDCNGPHGPQETIKLPIRYVSVLVNMRT
jgi:transcriptional regulator with XRE-family HTH domain